MAEQLAREESMEALTQESLTNSKDKVLQSVGNFVIIHSELRELEQQTRALRESKEDERTVIFALFNQYKADIISAVESGVVTGRELVRLFADYEYVERSLTITDSLPDAQNVLLEQFDAMQPGVMVAVSDHMYGSNDYFDHILVEITDSPLPIIVKELNRLVLSYEFSIGNEGKKILSSAGDIIIGKENIITALEKAATKYIEQSARESDWWRVLPIESLIDDQNLIVAAEQLDMLVLAQDIKNAKTKVALEIFDNLEAPYAQEAYIEAAHHLLTRSPKDFYQVLGNLIIDTEEIIRRERLPEYKLYAAMYFAGDTNKEKKYGFTKKEHLQAAAWFAKQHDLLVAAEQKATLEVEQ